MWKYVKLAIWEVIHIVGQPSIAMHQLRHRGEGQRALPPDEYVDPDHIRRMIEGYWQTDLSDVEPPEDLNM